MIPAFQGSVTERVVAYVEQHYASQISLRDVASAMGYSPSHLTTMFRRETGMPVNEFIIRRRIRAAQDLLRRSAMNVSAACEAVGFNDPCYFSRQFSRRVGTTPTRFRVRPTDA